MKKFLIIIILFVIFISSGHVKNNFTLLDYFSGEYLSYTDAPVDDESVNLGFCYMQNNYNKKYKLVGESLKIKNFEPGQAIEVLKAEVIKTEYLENGTVVIYAYSRYIDKIVTVDNKNVNLQIAHNDEYSIIGWPLILGSF